ncbi:citrate transporter-domain-containing protein [Gaertneriomyces semiglobifer]|nr:citrate transporter-domain-containing protein [Gaertneriomyces semiglobifer]
MPTLTFHSYFTLAITIIVILCCIYPIRIPVRLPSSVVSWWDRHRNKRHRHDAQPPQDAEGLELRKRHGTVRIDLATAPVLGVLVLWAAQAIDKDVVWKGVVGEKEGIRPFAVLVLIFGLAYLCISTDETHLFTSLSYRLSRHAPTPFRLFLTLFLLSTVLTIFTSNDVVVLTVTPIVCYLTSSSKIDPTPYLVISFIAANVASMTLYIGNPTNVIVCEAFGIGGVEYSGWMVLPTLVGTCLAFVMGFVVLRGRLKGRIDVPEDRTGRFAVRDRRGAVVGSVSLVGCLVCLMCVQLWVDVEVWVVTLPFVGIVAGRDVWMWACWWVKERKREKGADEKGGKGYVEMMKVESGEVVELNTNRDKDAQPHNAESLDSLESSQSQEDTDTNNLCSASSTNPLTSSPLLTPQPPATDVLPHNTTSSTKHTPSLPRILRRLPYPLIPFALGMFTLTESLSHTGFVSIFARYLAHTSLSGHMLPLLYFTAIITTLACNLMNNLPMTILFVRIFAHPEFGNTIRYITNNDTLVSVEDRISNLQRAGLFALVIGSNLGANLTYIGSLAGLMFNDLLKSHGVTIRQWDFFRWCLGVTPVVLVGMVSVLAGELVGRGYNT